MQYVLLILSACATGDWPQFRGSESDGHVRETITTMQWSNTENVVWKVPIPGLGWSSPVYADGKLYVTTAVARGDGLSLRAMSLDATTGKVIWDREVRAIDNAPAIHAKNSHASPTPIVRDGSVFVHFGALGTARLSVKEGAREWLCAELVYPPMHGSGGSPMLHEGKLVVVCDGSVDPFVAALDASTGKIAWKTPRGIQPRISHSFVTATIATVNGKSQVLAPGPDHFAAYDLATGKELWRVVAPGWSVVPQPTVFGDLVIYNRDYDNPELMAVRLGGSGDVTQSQVVWRRDRGAPSTPTPVLVDGALYFVSDKGVASCIDAATGDQVWMERLGGNYSASPIFVNGHIMFLSEDGVATWVKPGKAFEIIQKNEVTGKTFATPAFADGAMYLRTEESLLKIAKP